MISNLRYERPIGVAVFFALLVGFPVFGGQDSGLAGNSRIIGKITAMDGKTAVPGATVIAYHLSTEAFYYSAASNAKGEFQLANVPAGYYDLAVRTAEGLYPGSSVVNVAPTRKVIANFSLMPLTAGPAGAAAEERLFPGSQGQTTGSADLDKKLTQREFWSSPKGVAILASGGTALLLAIVSADDEQIVSGF